MNAAEVWYRILQPLAARWGSSPNGTYHRGHRVDSGWYVSTVPQWWPADWVDADQYRGLHVVTIDGDRTTIHPAA